MKRVLALLLAMTMVFTLVACGGTGSTAATGTESGTETGTEAPATEGGNKLTVWCWDPAFNIYAMNEAAKEYQKTNPDFELEVVETPWADIQTKLTTAATSDQLGSLPDIMLMQDNAYQKNCINYPDAFMDLTDSEIAFDKFAPAKVAYSVIDGKNYGVPFDNGTCVNAVRTDILEEAGYTIKDITDVTWDKYIEIGKDVLAKTGKPLLSSTAGEPDLIMEMLQSCGSSLFKEDGSLNIVGNEAVLEVMNVYTELVKSGICVEVNNWDEYIATFINGSVAGTINGCWILASIQTAEDQAGKWAITNVPSLNAIAGASNYSNNGGSSWGVTTNCKNPDLAKDFLAKTFAGSVPFYETILPKSGALATYLPVGDSAVYAEPQDFFAGQAIYADITTYAGKVPSNVTGVYYYEARDAMGTAMTAIVAGGDPETELKNAEETVKFQMGQ